MIPTSMSAELGEGPIATARQSLRDRTRRFTPAALAVAAVLIAPLVAGAALAVVAAAQSPLESADEVAPLNGIVERAERADDVQVPIAVEFAPTPVAVAAGSGVITVVSFIPGDRIETGTRLIAIDDRDVVAYISEAPLYRDLTRGAKGRDVSTAQTLLAQLGFDPGPANGTVGSATERAIVAFNGAHGFGARNAVLALSSLSWVGTEAVVVAEATATLGTVVAPGSVLFKGVATATAITVREPPAVTDAALQLVVGDIVATYEQGRGRVTDPAAVAAVAAIVGTATDRLATLRRADPLVVGTVPAASVVTDRTGASCVFPDAQGKPIAIEPLGGSLGTVDVDAALIGRSVLLNPRDVRSDLGCAVN